MPPGEAGLWLSCGTGDPSRKEVWGSLFHFPSARYLLQQVDQNVPRASQRETQFNALAGAERVKVIARFREELRDGTGASVKEAHCGFLVKTNAPMGVFRLGQGAFSVRSLL